MVTRTDIADSLAHLFSDSPVSRDRLLDAAAEAPGPPGLVDVLEQLPERDYRSLRDLWAHLSTVPVE